MPANESQLYRLSKPFPPGHIYQKPGASGGSYVPHALVRQRLIGTLGMPPSQRVVDVLYEDLPPVPRQGKDPWPACPHAVTGAVVEFTFRIDHKDVVVQEVGSVENAHMVRGNGERLKRAVSDALKRAAAAVGCGLHLWSHDVYFLEAMLGRREVDASEDDQQLDREAVLVEWLAQAPPEAVVQAVQTRQLELDAVLEALNALEDSQVADAIEEALEGRMLRG